jgi:hypothetical protein
VGDEKRNDKPRSGDSKRSLKFVCCRRFAASDVAQIFSAYAPTSLATSRTSFGQDMFFRFGSSVFLVVLISLVGIAIEKQNLHQRREFSRQHYQMDVLRDEHTRLRLRCQKLASIERLFDSVDGETTGIQPLVKPIRPIAPTKKQLSNETQPADQPEQQKPHRRVPLLFFERPLKPKRRVR